MDSCLFKSVFFFGVDFLGGSSVSTGFLRFKEIFFFSVSFDFPGNIYSI